MSSRSSVVVRKVLMWSGFVLGPLVLNALLVIGGGPQLPIGLPYVLPLLALAVLLLAVRRAPAVAIALMFLNLAAVDLAVSSPWESGLSTDMRAFQLLALDVAVGYVAATRSAWMSSVTAVIVLIGEAGAAAAFTTEPQNRVALPGNFGGNDVANAATQDALILIVAWVVGNAVRQRRHAAGVQRAQAESRAVQEERLRIAREVHDMVAHSIGVIAIQAGMGRRVIDTQPTEARDALAAIEDTSRDTLAALRRLLGTLRRAEAGAEAGSDAPPLAPTPGLASLDGLVARSQDAGVLVEVHRRGEQHPLPPDIDLSAYRLIQEAVTNVIRHAGTGRCEVLVDQRDGELSVEVTDDGRGGLGDSGYGIVGMRERVSLLDGEFSAGPRPDGGFRVSARIPLPLVGALSGAAE